MVSMVHHHPTERATSVKCCGFFEMYSAFVHIFQQSDEAHLMKTLERIASPVVKRLRLNASRVGDREKQFAPRFLSGRWLIPSIRR